MSHSTEIKVEIGLDSYHLHCGVAANQSKTFADDAALAVLYSEAEENKSLYAGHTGWLKVEITQASSTSIALVQSDRHCVADHPRINDDWLSSIAAFLSSQNQG